MDGLQRQIDEKKLREMEEVAESKSQEERDQYITMLMEQQAAEDREMKRRELKELRGTWEIQANLPKNNSSQKGEPVNVANCGVSAVQKFAGEVIDCIYVIYLFLELTCNSYRMMLNWTAFDYKKSKCALGTCNRWQKSSLLTGNPRKTRRGMPIMSKCSPNAEQSSNKRRRTNANRCALMLLARI